MLGHQRGQGLWPRPRPLACRPEALALPALPAHPSRLCSVSHSAWHSLWVKARVGVARSSPPVPSGCQGPCCSLETGQRSIHVKADGPSARGGNSGTRRRPHPPRPPPPLRGLQQPRAHPGRRPWCLNAMRGDRRRGRGGHGQSGDARGRDPKVTRKHMPPRSSKNRS